LIPLVYNSCQIIDEKYEGNGISLSVIANEQTLGRLSNYIVNK